jgi:hypothetical protein
VRGAEKGICGEGRNVDFIEDILGGGLALLVVVMMMVMVTVTVVIMTMMITIIAELSCENSVLSDASLLFFCVHFSLCF